LNHVASLGELARQTIPCPGHSLQRQILCLTNKGIHVLQKVRPIDYLYRFLSQDNFTESYCVRDFFALYGTLESAAMCLSIACGLPADAGGAKNLNPCVTVRDPALKVVQSRAVSAMLSNAATDPSFRSTITSTMGGSSTLLGRAMDARLVHTPISADLNLTHTPVHDAFHLLASRILRPIWLRALASSIKQQTFPFSTPPKVHSASPIWSRGVISCIRSPLVRLLRLLEQLYPTAVKADLSVAGLQGDTDGPQSTTSNGRQLITRQIELQSSLQKNPEKVLMIQARALEDASLRGLYRLISRSIQALALIDLLRSAQEERALRVPWSSLAKLSFKSLVISQGVHDKVKKMLVDLIGGACKVGKVAIADQMTARLTAECYQYFSAGDRYSYEASRSLDALKINLSSPVSRISPEITYQVSSCIELLSRAARFWRSIEDVKDGISLTSAGESLSVLSKSCTLLRTFGEVGRVGVVTLCTAAAKNFERAERTDSVTSSYSLAPNFSSPNPSLLTNGGGAGNTSRGCDSVEDWDRNLYHGGSVLTENDCIEGRKACYECLLKQIMAVKSSPSNLGGTMLLSGEEVDEKRAHAAVYDMIERSLAVCGDPFYRTMLFRCLLAEDSELLVKLRPSTYLEDFLRDSDPMLLCKYYRLHNMYMQAAYYMDQLSKGEEDLDIEKRIDYLNRAVSSASAACDGTAIGESKGGQRGFDRGGRVEAEYLAELEGKREIARFQQMAYEQLNRDYQDLESHRIETQRSGSRAGEEAPMSESQKRSMDALSDIILKLKVKLVSISSLFNDIAMPYKLWEISLLLMHTTRTDNPQLAMKLLRSIIYRIIPQNAETPEGKFFLSTQRTESNIFIDLRRQQRNFSFESNMNWIGTLTDEISTIGSQLHGPEGDFAFPLALFIEELEDIAAACSVTNPLSRGWTLACMERIGVTVGSTVEGYMGILDRWGSLVPAKHVQLLSSISYAIIEWKNIAMRQSTARSTDIDQLYQVVRSGRLKAWAEKLRSHTATLLNNRLSEDTKKKLLVTVADLAEIKSYIDELVIS
jgi:hypothetical protein